MNIIFGTTASEKAGLSWTDVGKKLEKIHGSPLEWTNNGPATPRIGIMRDGGVITGFARDDSAVLAYVGTVTAPIGQLTGHNSLDDANRTAEALLRRYRQHDRHFLDGITGQYSVVLYDASSARVLLGADPEGVRSFFVLHEDHGLRFCTNLFTLAQTLGDDLIVDRSLEDFFLVHGFYPWGRTPYKGVTALRPGQLLEWQNGELQSHEISTADPWKGRFQEALEPTAPEGKVLDLLYDALLTATEEQLASDNRAAVLLGGFDSALVASLLHRLGKQVETYSFHYEEGNYNQPHINTLGDFLGVKCHKVTITRDVFEVGLRNFPVIFNQPTNWPNYVIQTDYLCQIMRRDGFRYCYSGDGCDTTFLGYPGTYRRARLFEALPHLSEHTLNILLALATWPYLDRALGHPYRVALNTIRSLGREMPARGYLSFRILDEISLRQLRQGPSPQPEQPLEHIIESLAQPYDGLPTLRLAYQGKAGVSPNRNKIVGSSDHNGVAILSPYLHPGMKSLAGRLPERLMRPDLSTRSKVTGKYILMRMAEAKGLLPSEVIYQRKVAAVDAPVDRWYAGPLRSLVLELLEDLPFEYRKSYAEALLRPKIAETLFKRHIMTDKVISHAISLLATYATFTALARRDS